VVTLAGLGHNAHVESPQRCWALLADAQIVAEPQPVQNIALAFTWVRTLRS